MRRLYYGFGLLLIAALSACSFLHEPSPFDPQPGAKTSPSPDVTFQNLSGPDLDKAERAIHLAEAEYPVGFLSRLGASIEPVRSLRLYGERVAGVTNNSRVFISYTPSHDRAFDDIQAFATVHHELAHVTFDRFRARFPETEWLRTLPSGFEYREQSGEPAPIDTGDAIADWELRDVKRGFLVEESKESMNEDFACIAAELFRNDSLLWLATSMSPQLKSKVDLAIGFYQSIEPSMTREWFQSLPHPLGKPTRSMNISSMP